MKTRQPPTRKALLSYSMIATPLAFAGLPLYMHMPDYYASAFAINIGTLGLLLLVARTIDAVQDPIIGYLLDAYPNHPNTALTAGIAILTASIAALSIGPPSNAIAPIWFMLFMIAATTGFSILTIHINKIGGFWSRSPAQKIRISAWRESFGLIGLLIAALTPTIAQRIMSVHQSFLVMLLIFAALIAITAPLFAHFLKTQKTKRPPAIKKPRPFALLPILIGRERIFWLTSFTSHIAAALPAALVIFFIRDYLNAAPLTGAFLALYFIAGAALMPIWSALSKRFGSYKTWLIGMALSIATFMFAYTLSAGDTAQYAIICALSGIALGADLALPPAILAQRIEATKQQNQASQYYAVLAFLPKIALACAAGLAFIALDHAGFTPNAVNSSDARHWLIILYSLAPCAIKALSAVLLFRLIQQEGDHNDQAHLNTTQKRTTPHGTTHIS